jgi:hypothetical protein
LIFLILERISIYMGRKHFTTSLDEKLLKDIRKLAIDKGCSANSLMEEGIEYILKKYQGQGVAEKQAEYGSSSEPESAEQVEEQRNKE